MNFDWRNVKIKDELQADFIQKLNCYENNSGEYQSVSLWYCEEVVSIEQFPWIPSNKFAFKSEKKTVHIVNNSLDAIFNG